jgi:hypothetical protein
MDNARVMSKVLVIDSNIEIFPVTKMFCDENNLIGLRAHKDNVMEVLKSNVDLGAILLAESYGGDAVGGLALGRQIQKLRPELPIFLRREHKEDLDDLDEKTRKIFCAAYTVGSMFRLHKFVEEYIFSLMYPNELVRGILEITEQTLQGQFSDLSVAVETPYVVKDRIICGEIISLIPIESRWCRGYMMLQTDDPDDADKGADTAGLKSVANALGEVTNLVWGSFKTRYIQDGDKRDIAQIQVPILMKLNRKYISFGSEEPQLCFKYTLSHKDDPKRPEIHIYQRFIFNLSWSPEDFAEVPKSTEDLVDSGELEMF